MEIRVARFRRPALGRIGDVFTLLVRAHEVDNLPLTLDIVVIAPGLAESPRRPIVAVRSV
jgi:hypothetical protein